MPKKQCTGPGCNAVIEKGLRYCDYCKKRDNKRRDKRERDPESKKLYNSKVWRDVIRPGQLSTPSEAFPNASPFCQCEKSCPHHPKQNPCGRIANEVDHMIPMSFGGSDGRDGTNIQSLCHDCHTSKTRKEDGWTGSKPGRTVFLVCGPPGSGKSTFVRKHRKPHHLVLDFDALMSALCGIQTHRKPRELLKYGWEARDAIYAALDKEENTLTAWIIITGTRKAIRDEFRARYGAKVFVLETPAALCMERIRQDEKRDQSFDWSFLVEDWWQHYEPSREDNVIHD